MLFPLLAIALLATSQVNGYTCPTAQQAGGCVNGLCGSGYICLTDNICCKLCSGAVPPVNGACPNGQNLEGNYCCPNQNCVDKSDSCQIWAKNGFCTSPYYTPQDKQLCAKTCGLC